MTPKKRMSAVDCIKALKQIQTIQHMLNDAYEGPAVAYWAGSKGIKRDASNNVVSFTVFDGDLDGTGKLTEATKTINARSLLSARKCILNEDVGIHRTIAAQFVGPMEHWEYDSDGLDALIQIALFGKVVYG